MYKRDMVALQTGVCVCLHVKLEIRNYLSRFLNEALVNLFFLLSFLKSPPVITGIYPHLLPGPIFYISFNQSEMSLSTSPSSADSLFLSTVLTLLTGHVRILFVVVCCTLASTFFTHHKPCRPSLRLPPSPLPDPC